ncbi:MAG: nucleotidyltransferase domain-containing protein [Phycisphaerales bacterium]|nr:nucleotidyltransferase domain-containing protein [Phycisphaerales bacterium]
MVDRCHKIARHTKSELLFQGYLEQLGIGYLFEDEYARELPNRKKRPDYLVDPLATRILCEVKELCARRVRPHRIERSNPNPYAGIRKEINEAQKQFREYKDHCCVLVLHNIDDWEFKYRPWAFFGAMLGDVGMTMPFSVATSRVDMTRSVNTFLHNGKMADQWKGYVQNTTFSAIVVLDTVRVPNAEYVRLYHERAQALRSTLGREPTLPECGDIQFDLWEAGVRRSAGNSPRVGVFENPHARIALPESLFHGEYDERYQFNLSTGKIDRVFAGRGLREIERLDGAADLSCKIDNFKQAVIDKFQPRKIILFGSHAYGSPTQESDVDLLVVLDGSGRFSERSVEIRRRIPCDFPLDLVTRSAAEMDRALARGDSFIREILARGKTLYEA